ncbi:MAG TPA: cysteine desulfurase family protein [Candidatus Methylomirabilis sp.]
MRAYLDHSATTPMAPEALAAMRPYLEARFGNASSLHAWGREARAALEGARDALARAVGAPHPQDLVFLSGGTEADNLAVKGAARAGAGRGRHVVVSAIEHHAVLEAAAVLEAEGFAVTRVPPGGEGRVEPEAVEAALRPGTILAAVMLVNNETGTIQPVAEIAARCRARGVLVHADCVQALGKIPVDVKALGVDLAAFSGHKAYGPKGTGALYVRPGTPMAALAHGGFQERSRRAGTEDVAGAVGFARAARLAVGSLHEEGRRLAGLRDRLEAGLLAAAPGARVNAAGAPRAPHIASLAFEGVAAESLLIALDLEGIAASAGAACSSGSLEPSHVLRAMGLAPERCASSVRFSLGRGTTAEEIEYTIGVVARATERLRAAVPAAAG